MTKAQEMLELHKAGLEQLLAALHAGDPNRELYVRVGDLMRETDALLRLAAQADAPGGQPQSPVAIGFAAYHPTLGWRPDLAAKSEQIVTALVMRSIDGAAAEGWEVRPIFGASDTRPVRERKS
jgi:hypothetical protein